MPSPAQTISRLRRTATHRTTSSGTPALFERDLRYVIGKVDHPRRDPALNDTRGGRRSSHPGLAAVIVLGGMLATGAGLAWHYQDNELQAQHLGIASKPIVKTPVIQTTSSDAASGASATPSEHQGTAFAHQTGTTEAPTLPEQFARVPAAPVLMHAVARKPLPEPGISETAANADDVDATHADDVAAIGGAGLYPPENDDAAGLIRVAHNAEDPVVRDALLSAYSVDAQKPAAQAPRWQTVTVKRGDTLSTIFERNGFDVVDALRLVKEKAARPLKSLLPESNLSLMSNAQGKLDRLRYELSKEKLLEIKTEGDGFIVDEIERKFDIRQREVTGTINTSLFESALDIGLDQTIIMQMAEIFEYQVDFNLDLRRGDRYSVIFEERWDGDRRIDAGEVVAAEFVNAGTSYRAIRHVDDKDVTRYFTPDGESMRRAFLRSPVAFSRISSGFSKRRFHPILKTWRAHKGVDYAARRGTPVRSTADGVIVHRGTKGGYGKTIVIRHGNRYRTLYAHMSRYKKGLRKGSRVSQGQVIGFVGRTGWATGDHLHYEFQVDGRHTNPLTVKLPRSLSIEDRYRHAFLDKASTWEARLDALNSNVANNMVLQESVPES